MIRETWRAQANGSLCAESSDIRLVIEIPPTAKSLVRYLVLRRGNDHPDILVGSGMIGGVQAAMKAAEQMADRCTELGHFPQPVQ
jgi:hypothetical protein